MSVSVSHKRLSFDSHHTPWTKLFPTNKTACRGTQRIVICFRASEPEIFLIVLTHSRITRPRQTGSLVYLDPTCFFPRCVMPAIVANVISPHNILDRELLFIILTSLPSRVWRVFRVHRWQSSGIKPAR